MGYYIRVLTPSEKLVPIAALEAALRKGGLDATITAETGSPEAWVELLLSHQGDGAEIAVIDRNPATPGSLGEEELEEFLDGIEGGKPASAAEWLRRYLPSVKTIYALQILEGTYRKGGWEAVHCVQGAIWSRLGGIFQADGEGFSNEQGHHILWQFADEVKGRWWMAVLQGGRWASFQMELGNRKQREAFLRGEVPKGVTRA